MPPAAAAVSGPEFHVFGASHWAALGAMALLAVSMILVARKFGKGLQRGQEVVVAVALLLQWPLSYWFYAKTGTLTVDNAYPCHLCDLAAILSVLVLLTRGRFVGELLYFWALAGTIQGLITPTLTIDFPSPRYFAFFIAHGGVVAVALYGVLGLRHIPRARAKWVAWGLINLYAVVTIGFNTLMGSNYGFLNRKPATASLYDLLGPWPWYIMAASGVALVVFLLLDLPFIAIRKRKQRLQD